MKILYAANNSFGSFLQLKRFLRAAGPSHDRKYEIRIAAYNASLNGINADYTLDSLHDFYGKNKSASATRKSVNDYLKEIETYAPDLIINDFDFTTSFVASELNIPYWIVSSNILYNAFGKQEREQLKFGRHYRSLIYQNSSGKFHDYQLTNADRRMVYSYLGDISMRPTLRAGFEWVRPYYVRPQPRNNESKFVAALSYTDKALVAYLDKLEDVSLYSLNDYEKYENIQHRNLFDDQYGIDVSNCYLYFSRGQTSLISDAFYNEKFSLIYPDTNDIDTLINSYVCDVFNTGEKIYTRKSFEQINDLIARELEIRLSIDPSIRFLHQHIESLL